MARNLSLAATDDNLRTINPGISQSMAFLCHSGAPISRKQPQFGFLHWVAPNRILDRVELVRSYSWTWYVTCYVVAYMEIMGL
jgi:hypothetical protein